MKINVPLDVPEDKRKTYQEHYELATHGTGRLMLFAGDQKIEHLNDDFYGEGVPPEDNDPEHMFRIASRAKIGIFASQLGLVARYGADYKDIPYIIKINSKSHLIKTSQRDPRNAELTSASALERFIKSSRLNIVGVGYTIYTGSEYEHEQFGGAAKICFEAHQLGLFSVVWSYPRGQAVADEKAPHLVAGAAGVAACLGADFVKVNAPKKEGHAGSKAELLREAVQAAGRTQLICAGGSTSDAKKFLKDLHEQIHIGGAAGNATGRNIHQRPLEEAIRLTNAISAITIDNRSAEEAIKIYEG